MGFPRVLVIGATGRIAAVLRKCWPQERVEERVVWQARARTDLCAGPGWAVFDPLADPGALARAAAGCSAILCLAGVTPARAAADGDMGDMGDNTALAEAAIRAGADAGATVFLASSAAVYGAQPGLLSEDCPLRPQTAYGRAKMEMEARGAALGATLGVPVCALRIGNIAGLDAILGGWHPGFRLDRFADGRTPARSYIGVATLARVLGDLMGARDLPDALNIASPGTVEMGALLDAAGLAWEARPAPESAIPMVALSTAALARFTTLPEASDAKSLAECLVEEWRA